MDEDRRHKDLIELVAKEYQEILENSAQGIYIYLDDQNKLCNKKFADLLGYDSEKEWASINTSFPAAFVAGESQEVLVSAFQEAVENSVASTNQIVWKKKDGSSVSTTVILVPISHEGHVFALHFVSN